MSSPYINTKRKRRSGKPSKFQKSFRRFILLAALVITCAAIYQLIKSTGAGTVTPTEARPPHGTLSELTDPAFFTQAYMSVNGNASLLERIQTTRVAGHMISSDKSAPFTLIKKRPDKMLLTIDRDSHRITFGVNGDTVWQRIRKPQEEDLFSLIEGPEAEAWLEQRHFFDKITSTSFGEGHISEINVISWEDSDCLQVTILDTDDTTTEVLVDPQTMYPIAELKTLPDGTINQTVFSDYRNVDGMPLPYEMRTSTDGEATGHIVLDYASLNSGVISRLFETPEALLEK